MRSPSAASSAGGRFQTQFALPPDARPGRVTVAAYAWSDRDATIGRVTLTVAAAKP